MKAFLFDLDGTLVDRNSGAKNWLREKFQPLFTPTEWDHFTNRFNKLDAEFQRDKPALFATLASEFEIGVSSEELVNDYRENVWRYCELFPGVESTLKALRTAGFRLAIVSNGTKICQSAKISGMGLAVLVNAVLISETEGVRKPDPELFLRAAQRLGVQPESCTMVGDSATDDIMGGVAAGMKTIWVE